MTSLTTSNESLPRNDSRIDTDPWGYFDSEKREYVLTTPFAPRPWKNLLWNSHYNAQPYQSSGGISYERKDSGETILLNWSGNKYIYFQNLDTGQIFSPSYCPVSDPNFTNFRYRYGLGYGVTEIEQYGLRVTITHSVDTESPCEYFELNLQNTTAQPSAWRVVLFSDLALNHGSSKFQTANPFRAIESADGSRIALESLEPLTGETRTAFLATDHAFDGCLFNRHEFTGTYGTFTRPDALVSAWPETRGAIETPAVCGYTDLSLEAGGEENLCLTLGLLSDSSEDRSFAASGERARKSRSQQKEWFDDLYGRIEVSTPDPVFDLFTNTWIKHQLTYCAYWNRGWAKGFRDSNQDAWAFTLLDPQRSGQMILDCLPYQHADGRTVRKWAPVDRDPYNDGGAWLIFATHAYVSETGDLDFLEKTAPFFESEETGTVYDHLTRGTDYLWKNRGDRNLCLMPYGDWNDRLTGIGKDGKGQSVWTTMALAESLRRMAEIAQRIGKSEEAEEFNRKYRSLTEDLRSEAWNGQWYSRAFTDAGDPVGAPECAEGSIYLLPQAWSLISGVATESQIPSLIDATFERLAVDHGFRLLTPPYSRFDPSIGLLSGTPPGHLENGGNYCHGTMFMAYALGLIGRVDSSLDAFKRVLPVNPKNPPSLSRQEPFSLTNSYYAPEAGAEFSGRSYFSWRTGAAGWAFRTAIESIMGVRAGIHGLEIRGSLPSDWDQAEMTRTYRGKTLRIEWKRTGEVGRSLNGEAISDSPIHSEQLAEGDNHLAIRF